MTLFAAGGATGAATGAEGRETSAGPGLGLASFSGGRAG